MSENMSSERTCPKCGARLAADTLEGLCPACLLALNLATQTELTGEVGRGGTRKVPPPPKSPPTPAEIASQFPQFEILECLGRGGMGVVYKARQKSLERLVALKILAPEREKDAQFAQRFAREARTLAQLNHPSIVTVHDFGEAGGMFYLVMEFVDGMNLRHLLRERKLSPEEALAIVPPVCEALQYAHGQGVIHRDIKPENLLLDKQGRIKIADFGIAKILGRTVSSSPAESDRAIPGGSTSAHGTAITREQVIGTPQYMAPEQTAAPEKVDHRADIYSLGVVLYEMLTGELPGKRIEPPSRKVQVDVRIDEIVLRALEREPGRRYQQASVFKTQVETMATGSSAGGEPARSFEAEIPNRKSPPGGMPAVLWITLAALGLSALAKLAALPKVGPVVLADATVSLLLISGIWFRFKAAYALAIALSLAGVPTALRIQVPFAFLGLAMNAAVIVPLLLATRWFFPPDMGVIRRRAWLAGAVVAALLAIIAGFLAPIPPYLNHSVRSKTGSEQPIRQRAVLESPTESAANLPGDELVAENATAALVQSVETAGALAGAPVNSRDSFPQAADFDAARQVVNRWIAAARAGRTDELRSLTRPPSSSDEGIGNIRGAPLIEPKCVVGNADTALIVSRRFQDDRNQESVLQFSLAASNGHWRIREVTRDTPENAQRRVEGFAAHPGVKFDVRPEDIIGTWRQEFFSPATYTFSEDGTGTMYFRDVGGVEVTLPVTWRIEGERFFLETERGASAGLVRQIEEDRFAIEGPDRSRNIFDRVKSGTGPVERNSSPAFGPVIERVLLDPDTGKGQVLKLKTGEFETVLSEVSGEGGGRIRRLLHSQSDLFAEYDDYVSGRWALITAGLKLADLLSRQWDSATDSDLAKELETATVVPHVEPHDAKLYLLPDGLLPMTFALETREKDRGILQIVAFTDNPRGVKIRYKLVQTGAESSRVLHFPVDRILGKLHVRDIRPDRDSRSILWEDWKEFADATGNVAVPPGKEVRFDVSPEGARDLSSLALLRPDDLRVICFLTGRATDDALKHIAPLTGLRAVHASMAPEVTDEGAAYCAGLTNLVYLNLQGSKITDESVKGIGELRSLEFLSFNYTRISDAGLSHITNLTLLKELVLMNSAVTDAGMAHVRRLTNLNELFLWETAIGDSGLESLRGLPHLKILELQSTGVSDRGLAALKTFPALRRVNLGDTDVTDAGLRELAGLPLLESVVLPRRITDEGIRHLDSLPALSELNLQDTQTTGRCLEWLQRLPSLRKLSLPTGRDRLRDNDLAHLRHLTQLEELRLQWAAITDAGVPHIAALTSLKVLLLGTVQITDAGYAGLRNLRLERLYLSDQGRSHGFESGIGDDGLEHIAHMATLKYLHLAGSRVTDRGLAHLRPLRGLETLVLNDTRVQGTGLVALREMRSLKLLSMAHTEVSSSGVDALTALDSVDRFDLQNIRIQPHDLLRLQAGIPSVKLRVTQAVENKPEPLNVGSPAPDFSVQTLDGKMWRLREQRGKTVLLYFWAMWCGPCVQGTPETKALEAELRELNPNLVMLSLSMDDLDTRVRMHVAKHGLTWPQAVIGLKSKIGDDYRITGAPTLFVIAPDGTLALVEGDGREIRATVKTLAETGPVK